MRLFAALALPAEVRAALAESVEAHRDALPPAGWVKSDNLHLTLVFFGEVSPVRIPALSEALRSAAALGSRLELRLGAAGAFPERGPIRLVWIGLEPAAALAELAGRLRTAAFALKIPFDRKPFASHVTLARCRRPWPSASRAALVELVPDPAPVFAADAAALVASELAAGGSSYRTLAELPLAVPA